jgi:hypothetical protein
MAHTPNDDRSDTMNPNNDAYAADRENRFGDDGDDDEEYGVGRPAAERRHELDGLVDPDLGPRARYRTFDFDSLRWHFEIAFATPESERRDRLAANAELLRLAHRVLEVAAAAAIRQGVGASVSCDETKVQLVLHDGRSIAVAIIAQYEVVGVVGQESLGYFGFARRRWWRTHLSRPGPLQSYERPRDAITTARPFTIDHHPSEGAISPLDVLVSAVRENRLRTPLSVGRVLGSNGTGT